MTGPTVRSATIGDADALLQFWRTAAHGASISDDIDGVTAVLARDADAVLIAESAGAIVGTLIAGWDGWRAHLYRLAVSGEHHRQGIARQLMTAAERRLTALGARRLDAMVLDDNTEAHQLYTALHYHPEPQWTRWVLPVSQ